MRWVRQKHILRVLIAGWLWFTVVGCCPPVRHGVIFRGDWSLEMNRVPWLTNRVDTHHEYSEGTVGCLLDGCADGCVDEGEIQSGFDAPGDFSNVPTMAAPPPNEGASNTTCTGTTCGICQDGGHSREKSSVELGYHNHPRFHPVPTQPVFSPRPERYSMIDSRMYAENVEPASSAETFSEPTPLPAGKEVIATPVPIPDEGWKPVQPETDKVMGASTWIFAEPAT